MELLHTWKHTWDYRREGVLKMHYMYHSLKMHIMHHSHSHSHSFVSDITIGFIITRLTYSANSRPVGHLGGSQIGSQICSQLCSSLLRVSNSIYISHSIYVWLVDLLTLCS